MAHNRLHAFGQNVHAAGMLAALDEFVLTLAMRHSEKIYAHGIGKRWKTGPECAREIRLTWAEIRSNLAQELEP